MPRRKGVFLKSSIAPTLVQNNVHSLPVPELCEWNYRVKYYLADFFLPTSPDVFLQKFRKGRGAIPPLLPPWQKKTRQIVLSSVKLTPSLSNRLLGGQLGTPLEHLMTTGAAYLCAVGSIRPFLHQNTCKSASTA